MRELIINALKTNPVGVGDHPTIVDTVEKELGALEHANGKLNVLVKYLERRTEDVAKEETKPKSK